MNTPQAHRLLRVRALIDVALPHLHNLQPSRRADAYEGIADITAGLDETMRSTAHSIAVHLREAEMLQLHFKTMCTTSDTETPIQSE